MKLDYSMRTGHSECKWSVSDLRTNTYCQESCHLRSILSYLMLREDREVALRDAQLDGHDTPSKTLPRAPSFHYPLVWSSPSSRADRQTRICHVLFEHPAYYSTLRYVEYCSRTELRVYELLYDRRRRKLRAHTHLDGTKRPPCRHILLSVVRTVAILSVADHETTLDKPS